MEKIEITSKNLEGCGTRLILSGETTDKEINFYGWGDKNKKLKFVIVKGFIDDWCVYIEDMNTEQSYEQVQDYGHKLGKHTAKILVDCSDEVLARYRE